uniref:Uncharacterized protein n=1 Tax=Cacopsylla melanoneura TaxID=428564 RepID=A0A8D8X5E9_9HEMI
MEIHTWMLPTESCLQLSNVCGTTAFLSAGTQIREPPSSLTSGDDAMWGNEFCGREGDQSPSVLSAQFGCGQPSLCSFHKITTGLVISFPWTRHSSPFRRRMCGFRENESF